MNITRHNYEEFFLLYVDNELNIAQRKAVETFVEENPDLRPELSMLQQSILPADDQIVFLDKQSLLKTSSTLNPVNDTNCEEYFILYADDELTNEQKDQVEQFVYRNPQQQANFELLQQVRLMPDSSIVFPDKYALYRSEEEEKAPVVRMRWWRIAAAAAVLLFVGGMGWYTMIKDGGKNPVKENSFVQSETSGTKQPVPSVKDNAQPALANNEQSTANDQAPALATNIDKKDQQQDQSAPKLPVIVKASKTDDLAVVKKIDKKKDEAKRNIQDLPNVPQEKSVALTIPDKVKASKVISPSTVGETNKYNTTPNGFTAEQIEKSMNESMATLNPDLKPEYIDEPIYPTEPDNKKNRMRGFFRKVSRVFDKATNADTDHEKSSIRIASFEFALK